MRRVTNRGANAAALVGGGRHDVSGHNACSAPGVADGARAIGHAAHARVGGGCTQQIVHQQSAGLHSRWHACSSQGLLCLQMHYFFTAKMSYPALPDNRHFASCTSLVSLSRGAWLRLQAIGGVGRSAPASPEVESMETWPGSRALAPWVVPKLLVGVVVLRRPVVEARGCASLAPSPPPPCSSIRTSSGTLSASCCPNRSWETANLGARPLQHCCEGAKSGVWLTPHDDWRTWCVP